MALTRTIAEQEIRGRLGALLTELDVATGTKDDLNSPLRRALRKLGYTSDATVSESNLASVSVADEEKYFDLCHYYTLELLADAHTGVDWSAGPRSEKESQLGKRIADALKRKRDQIENEHSINMGNLKVSSIRVIELNPVT